MAEIFLHIVYFDNCLKTVDLLAGAKRTSLQVGWSQEAGAVPQYKIEHNSLNF